MCSKSIPINISVDLEGWPGESGINDIFDIRIERPNEPRSACGKIKELVYQEIYATGNFGNHYEADYQRLSELVTPHLMN